MQINGTGAIVFGGGSGLGEATARRRAAEGAHVVVADIAEEAAAAVAKEIGGEAVTADVTDPATVQAAIERVADLRWCVNCAGVATPGKLVGRDGPTPLEAFARVIEINLLGTINVLRLAAGAMMSRPPLEDGERGACVTTASAAAYEGQVGQVAYAASKGGVAALTLPVARELSKSGIRVVSVAPGLFETPMLAGLPDAAREALGGIVPFPARLGHPEEYAQLVVSILENRMLNGEVIRLDGAVRLPPR